ncbi:MAG: hypothetical protein QME94_09610, partial [Anaerolineae bacterium]|nr:hypothetical protein [Anaerolineae bacterium]
PEERQAVEQQLARVREAAQGNDPAAIRSAVQDLHQAMYRISERVYAGARERPRGPGEEEVFEAEFRPI